MVDGGSSRGTRGRGRMSPNLPFDTYPGKGRILLKMRSGLNTRDKDAPEFIRLTRATHCVYCGEDMLGDFYHWLTIALDHVVPITVCKAIGIDESWCWDYANCVLSCGACNGFCNRYKPSTECAPSHPTLAEFLDLRDRIFRERYELIRARREQAQVHYRSRPWESSN